MRNPVVASHIGGLEELVEHEQIGLLVPPKYPRALAEALVCVLMSPDEAGHLGEKALKRAHTVFWCTD
jgi:glycosyltransferase involved in cell wall biosynthesis